MADYGTVEGVFVLFPKVGSVATVTSAVVSNYLGRAESRINLRIAHLHTIPVTCAPPALGDLSETLTMAMILRRFYTQEKENVSEWVDAWFKEVNEELKLIATGSASLVCSGGGGFIQPNNLTPGPFSNTMAFKPTFDNRGFIFQRLDPERIDEENAADDSRFDFLS